MNAVRLGPSLVAIAALVGCAGAAPPPPHAPAAAPSGHAMALGYGGAIDTDVALDDLLQHDLTLMAWILPEHPFGPAGPVFAENGEGAFAFGLGDYRWGHGGYRKKGAPVLYLRVGTEQIIIAPARDLHPFEWRHVAVVRRGNAFQAYVDGVRAGELEPKTAANIHGALRIGRRTPGAPSLPAHYEGQFYGLVDDVAVFARALDDAELVAAARPDAHPSREGAVAVLDFEEEERGEPAPHWRPWGAVARVGATADRDGTSDVSRIPLPRLSVPVELPFDVGQAWQVLQGNDDSGVSHNGYAAFSWDFVLAGKPAKASHRRNARALGPGEIVVLKQGEGNNAIKVRLANGEFYTYMHLDTGSIGSALGVHGDLKGSTGLVVKPGQQVGLVGDTGAGAGNFHLHVAFSNGDDETAVTRPGAFSDYEVSVDDGRTWTAVALGVPRQGEWVRRMR